MTIHPAMWERIVAVHPLPETPDERKKSADQRSNVLIDVSWFSKHPCAKLQRALTPDGLKVNVPLSVSDVRVCHFSVCAHMCDVFFARRSAAGATPRGPLHRCVTFFFPVRLGTRWASAWRRRPGSAAGHHSASAVEKVRRLGARAADDTDARRVAARNVQIKRRAHKGREREVAAAGRSQTSSDIPRRRALLPVLGTKGRLSSAAHRARASVQAAQP
jgi:hypothetical protein